MKHPFRIGSTDRGAQIVRFNGCPKNYLLEQWLKSPKDKRSFLMKIYKRFEAGSQSFEVLDDWLSHIDHLQQQLGALKTTLRTSMTDVAAKQPSITPTRIRRQLKARRFRSRFFGPDLFADPAWDILLEAYAAHLEQRSTSVTALCNAAAVPQTTALRWIRKLERDGMLLRKTDPQDGRRFWLEITDSAAAAMRDYLNGISITLPI